MTDNRKRSFWHVTCNDILTILCAAAVPIALGIYTAITYQQEKEQAMQAQQLTMNQTIESRQDKIYDNFLNNVYNLDKDGYLNETEKPWAFANAYYRAAHRQLDPLRKGDVLQFLKEKELIGRNDCSTGCNTKEVEDIIRLNELNFDDVHLKSQTGILNRLNLECIIFDQVSMTNAIFSYANLNGASFDHGRLKNANFENTTLFCARFNGTNLDGVDFGNADFDNVYFENVDLSTAKLTDKQISQATFGNNVILPHGKTTPKKPISLTTSTSSPSLSSAAATFMTKDTATTLTMIRTTEAATTTLAPICTTTPNTSFETSFHEPAQCSKYTLDKDATRNVDSFETIDNCDNRSPFGNEPVWFRFQSPAGTMIINYTAPSRRLGKIEGDWASSEDLPTAATLTAKSSSVSKIESDWTASEDLPTATILTAKSSTVSKIESDWTASEDLPTATILTAKSSTVSTSTRYNNRHPSATTVSTTKPSIMSASTQFTDKYLTKTTSKSFSEHLNALGSGWYAGQYPSTRYTTATSIACFIGGTGPCHWCNLVSITNCDGFFVFALTKPPECPLRYRTI